MRNKRRQKQHQRIYRFRHHSFVVACDFPILIQAVHQLHNCADCCVKVEPCTCIIGHPFDGGVYQTTHIFIFSAQFASFCVLTATTLYIVIDKTPHAIDKPITAFYSLIIPFQIPFRRCGKQDKQASSICAEFINNCLRTDDVALGFGHLAAVHEHHTLGEQILERLIYADQAHIIQHFGEKPRIQ